MKAAWRQLLALIKIFLTSYNEILLFGQQNWLINIGRFPIQLPRTEEYNFRLFGLYRIGWNARWLNLDGDGNIRLMVRARGWMVNRWMNVFLNFILNIDNTQSCFVHTSVNQNQFYLDNDIFKQNILGNKFYDNNSYKNSN